MLQAFGAVLGAEELLDLADDVGEGLTAVAGILRKKKSWAWIAVVPS